MKKILGILVIAMLCLTGVFASEEVNVDLDVDSGFVEVDISDSNSNVNFKGLGEFEGSVNSKDNGNGIFDTNVLVESKNGASLSMSASQKLLGYTDNRVKLESYVFGDEAVMNNRFDGSSYIVSYSRVDNSRDLLSAKGNFGIGFSMSIKDELSKSASSYVEVLGSGSAKFDTNQWHSTAIAGYGWGNPDTLSMPSNGGYYNPVNTVEATGEGVYSQYGYGKNSLEFNGFTLGSGSAMLTANYDNGIIGNFKVKAN